MDYADLLEDRLATLESAVARLADVVMCSGGVDMEAMVEIFNEVIVKVDPSRQPE